MNIKKAYFFINELDKKGYNQLQDFLYLKGKDYKDILDKHYTYGLGNRDLNKGKFDYGTVLEVLFLTTYLQKKGINDFETLYKNDFFICNEYVYIIKNSKIQKFDIKNIFIGSLRTKFDHPFFEILDILLKNNNSILKRSGLNNIETTPFIKNKYSSIISLYKDRKKYLGNIIIPYNIKKENYNIFYNWVGKFFSNKIVIKEDGIQCGSGLTLIDFNKKNNTKIFGKILLNQHSLKYRPYILPYYDFVSEYRIYFTKIDGEIKIYSIKKKELINRENLFDDGKMKFNWYGVSKNNWSEIENEIKISYDMIEKMDFTTGTLEFGITFSNQIIFFEVNQFGNPMMFKGDEKDILKFYLDTFDDLTKDLK